MLEMREVSDSPERKKERSERVSEEMRLRNTLLWPFSSPVLYYLHQARISENASDKAANIPAKP